MGVRPGTVLWRTWLVRVTLAEVLGFGVPLTVGALTARSGSWVAVPALLAAGAVEGAALGAGQASVLSTVFRGFPVARWVAVTSTAAVVCYALGLLPSLAANVWTTWPAAAVAAVSALLAIALLGTMGTAQWWVLRRHVTRAALWIPATAAAWLVGLGVFLGLAVPWWEPGQPTVLILVVGLVAALVMATAVAAITGWTLVRLIGGPGRQDLPRSGR